jgi:hypothetical protein
MAGLVNYVTSWYVSAVAQVPLRQAHLAASYAVFNKAFAAGAVPKLTDFPTDVLYTTIGAILLVNFLLSFGTKKGRGVYASILNVAMSLVALGVLIGFMATCTLGPVYATYKVTMWFVRLATTHPLTAPYYQMVLSALQPYFKMGQDMVMPHINMVQGILKPYYTQVMGLVNGALAAVHIK